MEEDDDDADEEEKPSVQSEPGCDVIESGDVGTLFLEQLKLASDPSERTDFTNFRSLLWRAMAQFTDRVEPRSRELTPLLLRFIRSVSVTIFLEFFQRTMFCYLILILALVVRNEFYLTDLLVAPTQDLRKRSDAALEDKSGMTEHMEEGEEEEEAEEGSKQQRKSLPRRATAK